MWRVWHEIFDDQVLVVAGSIAFFAILAAFPMLIAIVSIYGLVADPTEAVQRARELTLAMPRAARELVMQQMAQVAATPSSRLGVGLIVSILFALLSAAGGVEALITGINIAYDEKDTRGAVGLRLLAVKLTLLFIACVVLSIVLIAALPKLLIWAGLGDTTRALLSLARWPALACATTLALSILYRSAPNRASAQWRWVVCGATLASLLWILTSVGLSFYVANFASFTSTYGAFGGVIALLLWFYLSSIAILLGAELNAELERQTAQDSTVGQPQPMGERAAYAADTLGPTREDGKKKPPPQERAPRNTEP
jgi:membrane protein